MSQAPSDGRIPSRRFGWRWLAIAAGAAILGVYFFAPADEVADVALDPANFATYAYFAAGGFHYGPEVIPMAGPFGFVPYGFLYGGQLFAERFVLELLTKLVLGSLAVWFLLRHPGSVLRWVWLLAFMLMAPLVEDTPYDYLLLLAGLALVGAHASPDRRALAAACGLAGWLAFMTLFKGTQTSLSFAILGLAGLQALLQRDFRRLPWIYGTYITVLVVLLLVVGQNPLAYTSYLRGMFQLTSGYNATMGLDETRAAFTTGVTALVSLQLLIVLAYWPRRREPRAWAEALLLAGFTFVQWKHGFVRADGHVYLFYQYTFIAAPMILVCSRPPGAPAAGWTRFAAWTLALVAAGCGLWGDGPQAIGRHKWAFRELPTHLRTAVRQVFSPMEAKRQLHAELENRREVYRLPLVRETVGNDSIDYFGLRLGYPLLNRLNYRPRAVGGGTMNVFSSWLQERNRAQVLDPKFRPAFFLADLQTTDDRLLAQDDPGTLRALLETYEPAAIEQNMLLLRARPEPKVAEPRLVATVPVRLGEPVTPPAVGRDEILLMTLSLPPSLAGRLRAMLYKPPQVHVDLEGEGIQDADARRLLPGLFQTPVPVNPVIENTRDLLELYGRAPGKQLRRFTVRTQHPAFFAADRFEARFFAMPRPGARDISSFLKTMDFPVSNVPPLVVERLAGPFRYLGGLPVQMLEPPGRIRLPLSGRENELSFEYGIDDAAWQNDGATDGVEFIAELERPNQPVQVLFYRWLRPKREPGDRGVQFLRCFLPPNSAGATISLRTGMGADRDGAWDWAYYTRIRITGDGFVTGQFPRFSRAPVAVNAATAGAIPHENRELFMLNSPGSLTFRLQGDERKLSFTTGLLPGAYTGQGSSDGVGLEVELRAPDGGIRRILTEVLNPRDNPRDRGDRPFAVDLPLVAEGTLLILTITPGPHGSDSWDWSYIESLRLE